MIETVISSQTYTAVVLRTKYNSFQTHQTVGIGRLHVLWHGRTCTPRPGHSPWPRPAARRDEPGLVAQLTESHLNLKLLRLSWSTDRHPISFMSRSISARRFPSARSTPA